MVFSMEFAVMPRIYTSANDPLDFCQTCFPLELVAIHRYRKPNEEGTDQRGDCFAYDAEHPDYESNHYVCCRCGTMLFGIDN